ncbi:MAG: methylated-DNA--[protein]-cysteine S-methyltransferase [Methylovirgula sp.]
MNASLMFRLERMASPIGTLLIVTDAEAQLRALHWDESEHDMLRELRRHYGVAPAEMESNGRPSRAWEALEAYFAGDLRAIDAIPVAGAGTPFQRDVWAALRHIPAGATLSYGGLAAKIGRPKAVRAVGLANGANPIAIFVPCHRVIGADASLTGYGGGLERKRWLLNHEGAHYLG